MVQCLLKVNGDLLADVGAAPCITHKRSLIQQLLESAERLLCCLFSLVVSPLVAQAEGNSSC